MPVGHDGSRPTRMRCLPLAKVLDEKVTKLRILHSVRNRRPSREHAVSGGVKVEELTSILYKNVLLWMGVQLSSLLQKYVLLYVGETLLKDFSFTLQGNRATFVSTCV